MALTESDLLLSFEQRLSKSDQPQDFFELIAQTLSDYKKSADRQKFLGELYLIGYKAHRISADRISEIHNISIGLFGIGFYTSNERKIEEIRAIRAQADLALQLYGNNINSQHPV